MAARSIASLSLSFGLVSIPVKLYSATESSAAVRFNLLSREGERLKQQYVTERDGRVVERSEIVRGYEFEKDRFVLFTPDELKVLQESPSQTIDIIAFLPERAVDPLYYDKAYFLAPDKRGAKPYSLLLAAMQESGRCALAKWAWKGRTHMVQVRPNEGGLVLQQLLYADEVRSIRQLDIETVAVSQGELQLALQIIDQIAEDTYEPSAYQDEEKQRILAAIDEKIAGHEVVAPAEDEPAAGAQVIDLMEALKASLGQRRAASGTRAADKTAAGKTAAVGGGTAKPAPAPLVPAPAAKTKERKGVQRAKKAVPAETAAPARVRARK